MRSAEVRKVLMVIRTGFVTWKTWVIQALARHRHLNTTMRYIDINDKKLGNAVELI